MDLKPKIKRDSKIKTAILATLSLFASLFLWIILKRALYSANIQFGIENSAQFWQWFWIRAGWPIIALVVFCSAIVLYMIAIKSRLAVFFTGILIAGLYLIVFFIRNRIEMIVYGCICALFAGALAAADGAIQSEERQRVKFDAKPLVKKGLAPLIPILILMLAAAYYFSPLPRKTKTVSVPDNIIDAIVKAIGNISDVSAEKTFDVQNFTKDYLKNNMPDTEGIIDDAVISSALKNISRQQNISLESSSSLIKDIKGQVNRQIEILVSKYSKYFPFVFTLGFLFMLKFLSAEFAWIVILATTILVKLCFVLGIFEKEVEVVEKENLVF